MNEDSPIVVQEADDDVLTAVPSENPPTMPLQCSVLLQVYGDPAQPGKVDMRMATYRMSWENLKAALIMGWESTIQGEQRAMAADKSVRAYDASGKALPTNKPIDISTAPGISEIVTLAKLND